MANSESKAASGNPEDGAGNQDQIDFWNGAGGATWVEASDQLDKLLAPVSDAVMANMDVVPGDRAIDIGCGCGSTSLALAEKGAAVWGVDISAPMLELAKTRAERFKDVAFSCSDAATQEYTPDHQWVFSRFGVMFFAKPTQAFANIRQALVPGGRLCFACWQAPRDNPWMSVVGQAISEFLPKPETPPDPRAPGPFAFADKGYLRSILQIAGFHNIQIDGINPTLKLADTIDQALSFQSQVGPLSRAMAELDDETKEQAFAAARKALEPHLTNEGIHLGAACWVVSAQA